MGPGGLKWAQWVEGSERPDLNLNWFLEDTSSLDSAGLSESCELPAQRKFLILAKVRPESGGTLFRRTLHLVLDHFYKSRMCFTSQASL